MRALEDLSIEGDGGLEARRVVGTFPEACVRREIEATPLRQLLKLVLVHLARPPLSLSLSRCLSVSLCSTLGPGGSAFSNARIYQTGRRICLSWPTDITGVSAGEWHPSVGEIAESRA